MVLHGRAKHGVKEKMVLAYMMPQTRRMEKSIVCRASSGIGCSNDKGRSRALHPDSTKMEKSIVRRASSGIGCSNDKGRSRVLHPDSTHCTFTLCHPKQKKEKSRMCTVCHFT